MEMKKSHIGSVAVLELSGRFDAYVTPPVVEWLEEVITDQNPQLLVNLAGVKFIDSTGLATLVQGMKRCRERDGDLYVCDLQQSVRVIFELTRLNKAITVFNTQAEALQAFNNAFLERTA